MTLNTDVNLGFEKMSNPATPGKGLVIKSKVVLSIDGISVADMVMQDIDALLKPSFSKREVTLVVAAPPGEPKLPLLLVCANVLTC